MTGLDYLEERNETIKNNRKKLEALKLTSLSQSLFKTSSVTKPSVAKLKPKLKVTEEDEVPVVRSSHELAKVMQIKREKTMSNIEHVAGVKQPNAHVASVKQPLLKIAPQAKFKLSNFITSGKKESQNHGPKKLVNEALMTKSKGSMQNHNPQKQPMTKVVIEEVESPMKVTVGENDNSRSKQNPKKRVRDEGDETMASQQSATKKTKGCKSMLIVDFLKEHNELDDEELEKLENEDDDEDELENEDQEENGENNGTIKKNTRGPTQCLKIHGRQFEEREEVILDDDGEPVGPNAKVLTGLSNFLGTIAKSSAFCPLIYTNFKGIIKNDENDDIWKFVQLKYIIPEEGRKTIFSRINGSWKSYKRRVKKNHYLKYSNLKDRLKHRPEEIPLPHFKILLKFWDNNIIQNLSKKNIVNRAKQRFNHRMGPKNFATIRKQLREKKGNGEDATQAEMFIETRQCRKGKKIEETETAIEAMQNPSQPPNQAFQSLFGKEKPGRIRCYGRTATPSLLKKKEEIATIKKQYEGEISSMKERMEAHESLTQKKMEVYESLLKSILMQQNPNLSEDDVNNMMGQALGIESAVHHSSTSTHVLEKFGPEDQDE